MEERSGHYEFGQFTLYPARRELRQGDIVISLDQDAIDVLLLFLDADGPLRHEALVAVLPGRSSARLVQALSDIRLALDKSPGQPSVIRKREDGSFQFMLHARLVSGRQDEFFEQPRLQPTAVLYAGLLGGLLIILGLAMTLIPPL